MTRLIRTHSFALKKTGSYYITHMAVAVTVAYAVTGDWMASVTLSLLEPAVQSVVYFFHERAWNKAEKTAQQSEARAHAALV